MSDILTCPLKTLLALVDEHHVIAVSHIVPYAQVLLYVMVKIREVCDCKQL